MKEKKRTEIRVQELILALELVGLPELIEKEDEQRPPRNIKRTRMSKGCRRYIED